METIFVCPDLRKENVGQVDRSRSVLLRRGDDARNPFPSARSPFRRSRPGRRRGRPLFRRNDPKKPDSFSAPPLSASSPSHRGRKTPAEKNEE